MMNPKKFTSPFFLIVCLSLTTFTSDGSANSDTSNSINNTPNIQGIWYYGTATPLARPKELGERLTISHEEADVYREKLKQQLDKSREPIDPTGGAPEAGAAIGFEADFNFAIPRTELTVIDGKIRTSLIVDPADGQVPIRSDYQDFHKRRREQFNATTTDGPESMHPGDRCLPRTPLPTLYPIPWNANLQIIQTEDYIVLASEASGPPRIVRLNAQHQNTYLRQWQGDSVAHWENNTLVIHTINFRPEQSASFPFPLSEEMEIIERITPIDKDQMLYAYTVTDPQAYTASFTVETIFKRQPKPMFEVACHEGNYSMANILAGARREEADSKN